MKSALLLGFALASASAVVAQTPKQTTPSAPVALSLDDALKIAQQQSQPVEIARSGVVRAAGGKAQARSQYMPQLNGQLGYSRTLQSQFSSFSSSSSSTTTTSNGDTTKKSSSSSGGFDLSKTSFGAKNSWTGGLSFSQAVYSGGRIEAQNAAADAQVTSANIEVTAQRAQASFDVTQAYYDAALADQLVAIADSSVSQTQVILDQTKVAKNVGNASEYELLRAQVSYQNQLPVAIQARANRDAAYLRLKQILNMDLSQPLHLTTGIEGANGPMLPAIAQNVVADTSADRRAPVRELDEAIRGAVAQVKIAKSERIPTFSIVSAYQRLYFPANAFPSISAGVNNWTLGVSSSFPILDGGRIHGDELIAQAGVQQAKAQREQARQLASLDASVSYTSLQEAQAAWEASRGTADQAERAYAIDQVRYREGISTQTDLSQTRLQLEQARANRAQAARNLAVARVKLALIHDLPLSSSGGSAGSAAQQQQQQQAQQQQQRATTTNQASGATTGATTGSPQP